MKERECSMSAEKGKGMTNPVIEAINKRMSIRSYKPKAIPKDVINTIIEAGNRAPSRAKEEKGSKGFNFQPWRFVVVQDKEFKQKLLQAALPFWKKMMESMKETHPQMHEQVMTQYEAMEEPKDLIYYSAPAILFVIGPIGYDISCALACENIMIAATSLGIGSCYVGFGSMVTGDADVVQALELKDDERIYGPIVLGYPGDEPGAIAIERPKKKDPVVKWI
jgi:nitroreductase